MMNYLTLVTLAITLATSANADKLCIPSGCSKQTACTTLSKGGLINLHLLGCSSIDISPTLNILKRDHPDSLCNNPAFGDVAALGCSGAVDQLESRSHHRETLCEDFSKAGLVNLSVLGCSKTTVNPVLNIGKRNDLCSDLADSGIDASAIGCTAHVKSVSSDKKKAKCLSLSKAGLVNLSLLNCSEFDLSGEYDILKKRDYCECTIQGTIKGGNPPGNSGPTATWSTKKHHATGNSGSGSNGSNGNSGSGSNGSNGNSGSGSNGSNGGSGSGGDDDGSCDDDEGSSTSSTYTGKKNHTKHHHSTATASTKTKHHHHTSETASSSTKKHHHSSSSDDNNSHSSTKTSASSSSETSTGTKTSTGSTSTPTGTCDSDAESICKSLSSANLINLDLLNCFNLKVDPTINVATGLLPAIESGIAGIIGIL